ncbi:MAG: nuclear transport factor 2 family protein [Solirubrobacterales bacterium]|nr:nuclear transport factor 2 family protein [Solirubrobacterales bacterium]
MSDDQAVRPASVSREQLHDWVSAYERLWRTAGTDGLSEVFAGGVVYSMAPYEEPVRGLAALAELWERERHAADEDFELTWEPVALEGATAVVRVYVSYGPPRDQEYRDLTRSGRSGPRRARCPRWTASRSGRRARRHRRGAAGRRPCRRRGRRAPAPRT